MTLRGWDELARLGRLQHGVASLDQALEAGFTASGVRSLVAASRLHRVHYGVYALGPAALSPLGQRMAAVLACGADASLIGRSCGGHLGLITNRSSIIDVAAPRRVRRPGPLPQGHPRSPGQDRP